MPCAVTRAEIEYYEKLENKKAYGVAMTNTRMLVYLLCLACKQIEDFGLQIRSQHLRRWWEQHMIDDLDRADT